MVKTNYSGLNPVVVQALNNLQYRYSGETPEMWYSCICYPFKKLLEFNPKYFSKNGFIQMIERSYKDGKFRLEECTSHIYCTVCNLLVFILNITEKCANNHLNKCIARIEQRRVIYVRFISWKRKVKKHLVVMKLMKFMVIFILDTEKTLNFIVLVLQKKLKKVLHIV